MRRNRESIWTNCALSIAVSAAEGVITTLVCMLLLAAFTYFFMDDMGLSNIFSRIALSAGGFVGTNICGRCRRRRGLAEGLICGAVLYAVLAIVSIIAVGGFPHIKKLLLLAACCAAGGVVGVNSKRPKWLRD